MSKPEDSNVKKNSPSADPSYPKQGSLQRAVAELQAGHGGEESFRILFDHFFPQVQRFFAKRVFSAEDRLDLTQETFLRIYKGIEGFRGEAQLGTWVFRIAYNTWLKWLERESNRESFQEAEIDGDLSAWDKEERTVVAPTPSPLENTLDEERSRLLRSAISNLPEKMRQCTELRIYQDLSYREIATTMRLSIETVKVHLFQARKKLRGSLVDLDF